MEESAPTLNLADVRRIIEPLYEGQKLFTGESVMAHAEGVVDILRGIRDDDDLLAAAYLFCVWNQLKNPKEWLTKHFGRQVCELVANLKVVIDVSEKARSREGEARISQQPDAVRRLLLALCTDLRVVLLRLASRLQTLRYFAATKAPGAKEYGAETLALYAPLANRLGIWQMNGSSKICLCALPNLKFSTRLPITLKKPVKNVLLLFRKPCAEFRHCWLLEVFRLRFPDVRNTSIPSGRRCARRT